jgi:hypothetical protein
VSVALAILAGLATLGALCGLFVPMGLLIVGAAARERGDLARQREFRERATRLSMLGFGCLILMILFISLYDRSLA